MENGGSHEDVCLGLIMFPDVLLNQLEVGSFLMGLAKGFAFLQDILIIWE